MSAIKVGDVFDLLTVKECVGSEKHSGKMRRVYLCICDCGGEISKLADHLKLKTVSLKSCGCYMEKSFWKKTLPERNCWASMFVRCYNPECKTYQYYGGKGVTVCDRWNPDFGGSFINFLADMGSRPTKSHTIDRANVDGDYEPSNCTWATRTEQEVNKGLRAKNTSGKTGVYFNKKCEKWEARISFEKRQLNLGVFSEFVDAVKARQDGELKYYGKILGH